MYVKLLFFFCMTDHNKVSKIIVLNCSECLIVWADSVWMRSKIRTYINFLAFISKKLLIMLLWSRISHNLHLITWNNPIICYYQKAKFNFKTQIHWKYKFLVKSKAEFLNFLKIWMSSNILLLKQKYLQS